MKLCKDCKHAKSDYAITAVSRPENFECRRPDVLTTDLVTGAVSGVSAASQRYWLGAMAAPANHCGKDGRYWEARP